MLDDQRSTDNNQTVKMPKGVALMVRSIIGIDPEKLFAEFQNAAKTMVDFCKHFDKRMVNLTEEVRILQAQIEQLKQLQHLENKHDRNTTNGHDTTGADTGIEHD